MFILSNTIPGGLIPVASEPKGIIHQQNKAGTPVQDTSTNTVVLANRFGFRGGVEGLNEVLGASVGAANSGIRRSSGTLTFSEAYDYEGNRMDLLADAGDVLQPIDNGSGTGGPPTGGGH